MTNHDPTLPTRLLDLLQSGIREENRSLTRLATLLGVSKGCIEYHVRNLRRDGQIDRVGGKLVARPTFRQLPLQLEFDLNNVVEMSEARRRRSALGDEAKSYCHVLVATEIPSSVSADEVAAALAQHLGARSSKVYGESHKSNVAMTEGVSKRLPRS